MTSWGREQLRFSFTQVNQPFVELSLDAPGLVESGASVAITFKIVNDGDSTNSLPYQMVVAGGSSQGKNSDGTVTLRPWEVLHVTATVVAPPGDWETVTIRLVGRPEQIMVHRPGRAAS